MEFPHGERRGRQAVRRFLVGDDNLQNALTKLAAIATETVPGVDLATITVIRGGKPTTPAYTDPVGLELDEMQYRLGDGPCLAAIRHSGVETWMTGDGRWPDLDSAAASREVQGTVSVALLSDEEAVGGLNLYTRAAQRLSREAIDEATGLADEIAIAVANAVRYDEKATLARQLEEAMHSRATIEQAKGILMAAQRCSPEQAFDILRRASQRENRKLRDIAAELVERAQQLR